MLNESQLKALGLTPAQIGVNATEDKRAERPQLDVFGNRYLWREVYQKNIGGGRFVVIPAGRVWSAPKAETIESAATAAVTESPAFVTPPKPIKVKSEETDK